MVGRSSGDERRRLVAESWARAAAADLAPDRVEVPTALADDEALDRWRTHPVAAALPVIRSLLGGDAVDDTGLVLTVSDAVGRLLWVDGDPRVMRVAEELRVVRGADWSERRAGTNAVGVALALDRPMQVSGEEHYAVQVQRLNCTAVPIRDLATNETLGILDITGGEYAVGPRALPLVEATVAAVERELLLRRIRQGVPDAPARPDGPPSAPPTLEVLGRARAVLTADGRSTPLSLRHAELLTLLAWHRGGLTAERLAELVHGRPDPASVRPEMTRLRRLLMRIAPALVPTARPYRLAVPLETDARLLVQRLDRGAHRAALDAYAGEVLPSSVAPGIREIRAEVGGHLREALLSSASPALLLRYADVVPGDPAPLRTAVQLLPPGSMKRAAVVARLAALA